MANSSPPFRMSHQYKQNFTNYFSWCLSTVLVSLTIIESFIYCCVWDCRFGFRRPRVLWEADWEEFWGLDIVCRCLLVLSIFCFQCVERSFYFIFISWSGKYLFLWLLAILPPVLSPVAFERTLRYWYGFYFPEKLNFLFYWLHSLSIHFQCASARSAAASRSCLVPFSCVNIQASKKSLFNLWWDIPFWT